MLCRITVLPKSQTAEIAAGARLLDVLRQLGVFDTAPCGGNGRCGKCKVLVDGKEALACQTVIDKDMTVTLPQNNSAVTLTDGIPVALSAYDGLCLAVDIGTTTVAAYLIENGQILYTESRKNPQAAYGADVVSRIQHGVKGNAPKLTAAIRLCVEDITEVLLGKAGKQQLNRVCLVGNPAMQQLFLGLPLENLTTIPFTPILRKAQTDDGGRYISAWAGASLLTVPDIAGYIGGDTVAGILATGMDKAEKLTLLVDIGTNGEMVLGNKDRLVACATAAGPALEGAGIQFGVQASTGAIDRVDSQFTCHVIGGGKALGICGSGLLDAAAAALHCGLINERGRIANEEHTLPLADGVFLTQEDIRQLQLAKGAISAGIRLMAEHLGVTLDEIETVYLAGAFGTYMDPGSACRVGLIPAELEARITPVGNAAGSGAMQIVCSEEVFRRTDTLAAKVVYLDLATSTGWTKCFAQNMRFLSEVDYWYAQARALGFSHAAPLDTAKLSAREDVRAMCAANTCRAYGKNWTCPPHCGTLEDCEYQMRQYSRGILLQTVGITRKAVDTKAYRETERQHLRQFYALSAAVKGKHSPYPCS